MNSPSTSLSDVNNAINGSEKILILIQLIGGNDGLNSIIPTESYDNLMQHRGNILLPEKDLIKTKKNYFFHPSLKGFHNLQNNGLLSIIHNVGYPLQNRSHFRSMDIWSTGSPSNLQWDSGWLGRYLDTIHIDYANKYPNETFKDPISISIGNMVADNCQGKHSNYSFVLDSLTHDAPVFETLLHKEYNQKVIHFLNFLKTTSSQTNKYSDRVSIAANKGFAKDVYNENNTLAQQLKIISKLIRGGLGTKIYNLSLSTFDTHAHQTNSDDKKNGQHPFLLSTISDAVESFFEDLKGTDLINNVLLITYSEFGRQIKSNAAYGTDHGESAPIFLFSGNLNEKEIGKIPVIQKHIPDQAALDIEFDFRDVYSSILKKWFSVEDKTIKNIFDRDYTILNI